MIETFYIETSNADALIGVDGSEVLLSVGQLDGPPPGWTSLTADQAREIAEALNAAANLATS